MTATEELRRMLDERGVEWGTGFGGDTFWTGRHGIEWRWDKQEGALAMWTHAITPEQAIEATLGRGTCEVEIGTGQQRGWWVCQSCGDLFDSGSALACKKKQKPRYCPNCGRRCVG